MKYSPSILSVVPDDDMFKLLEDKFERIHLDFMDGTFTERKSKQTSAYIKNIKTKLVKDLHMMVDRPEKYIHHYKKAGVKIINFHIEIGRTEEIIKLIRKHRLKVGLVINPETSVKKIEPFINKIDEVVVMTVHPGKGGQKFISRCAKKIKQIRKLRQDIIIKVDGGLNKNNVKKVKDCDYAIFGHYLFKDGMPMKAIAEIDKKKTAFHLRENVIKMLVEAGSGHPAGSLGMADIFTELFCDMKYNPLNPNWEERDYLVLSNGHICPIMYSAMSFFGFFSEKELLTLRKFGSRLQGHPHRESLPGLETTSGPLGCGISQAAGMALGLKLDKKQNRVICLVSDGEHDEGNTWEGVMFASKYNLNNLTCIMDYNNIQLSGDTKDIMPLGNLKRKYKAFGWNVRVINGHSFRQIKKALKIKSKRPLMIIAKTTPGKGVFFMENKWEWHGKAPTENALNVLRNE